MLQLRNTPDSDCNVSPAQILFGRPIRDEFAFVNRLEKFSNRNIRFLWRQAWAAKEDALRTRMTRTNESLSHHSRPLRPLVVGEQVFLQNQTGPNAVKWDRTGIVMESIGNDQYWIKVDGSGRLTRRNRRFLRVFTPTQISVKPHKRTPPLLNFANQESRQSSNQEEPHSEWSSELPPSPNSTTEHHNLMDRAILSGNPQILTQRDRVSGETMSEPSPKPNNITSDSSIEPLKISRPKRAIRKPKKFEPETGKWVDH